MLFTPFTAYIRKAMQNSLREWALLTLESLSYEPCGKRKVLSEHQLTATLKGLYYNSVQKSRCSCGMKKRAASDSFLIHDNRMSAKRAFYCFDFD